MNQETGSLHSNNNIVLSLNKFGTRPKYLDYFEITFEEKQGDRQTQTDKQPPPRHTETERKKEGG